MEKLTPPPVDNKNWQNWEKFAQLLSKLYETPEELRIELIKVLGQWMRVSIETKTFFDVDINSAKELFSICTILQALEEALED